MPNGKPVAGIDLGGTNMQIGVVDRKHRVVGKAKRKTKADEGRDAVLERITEGVAEACKEAGVKVGDLAALGIGAPGVIEPESGVVIEAVNLRWNNTPLADLLRKALGIPIFVDNDVNAAVYGEHKLGAGRDAPDVLGVWVGTGIGGGLILDGKLRHGEFHSAGEIGHTILFPGCAPGNRSLEHNCSRTAIVERLVRLIRGNRKSVLPSLVDGDLTDIKSKAIAKAYEMGDELTIEVVDNAADLLGIAVAGTVTTLSLGRVVLGGGLVESLGESFVERVRRSTRRNVFPDKCRQVDVVGTKLMDEAGLLGAALIAIDRMKE